jgi:hypothetical protein
MKKSISVAALLAAAFCMQAAEDNKSEKAAPAPQALTIPQDAVKEANGTYSYTDKQGKKWVYRNSPFGVIRTVAPEPGPDARPNPAAAATKATDKGDTVQFERPTPFGLTKWEKKKSDLTNEERRIFDAQNQSKTETQTDKPDAK